MNGKHFSAWVDLCMMTAILLVATLIAGSCMAVVMSLGDAAAADLQRRPLLFITYTLQFSLAVAGGFLWLRLRGGVRWRVGVSWADGPVILAGVVLVTAASVVLEPVMNLFPERWFEQLNAMIGRGGWTIMTTVVMAPILEEMFFRGLLLESLSRRWSAAAAVFASAAVFGLVHLNPPQALNAFVIAVIMGYLYLLTRSLIPVIAIHAINNGLAYMALELTGTQTTDTRAIIGNDTIYWLVYAASASILVASLFFLALRARTKTGETALNTKQ